MTKTTIELARSAGLLFEVFDDEYCDAVDLPRGTIGRIYDVGIDDIAKLIELVRAEKRASPCAKCIHKNDNYDWICMECKHFYASHFEERT